MSVCRLAGHNFLKGAGSFNSMLLLEHLFNGSETFPLTPHVRLSVGRSVCHNFKFHFPCLFLECADIFLVVFIFPLAKCRTMVYRCQTKDLKTSLKTKKGRQGEFSLFVCCCFFAIDALNIHSLFFDHIFFL